MHLTRHFHWQPSEFDRLTPAEILHFAKLAGDMFNPPKEDGVLTIHRPKAINI